MSVLEGAMFLERRKRKCHTSMILYMPPCIANEDNTKTKALMMPHANGIQVDIRK